MTKNFKPDEVIGMIQKKVQLKRDLKEIIDMGKVTLENRLLKSWKKSKSARKKN